MKGVWTLTSFQYVRCASLPRRWKAPRPQQDTTNRWLVISKWPRSIKCTTSAQNYQMVSTRRKNLQPSRSPPNQYKKSFDHRLAHKNKDGCSKCGDSAHPEGFQWPAKNSNARHAISLTTTQAFAFRKPSKNKPITSTGNPLHIS